MLAAMRPTDQHTILTLGQTVLGGTAISLLRAWIMLDGGAMSIVCGDSAYRFSTSHVRDDDAVLNITRI